MTAYFSRHLSQGLFCSCLHWLFCREFRIGSHSGNIEQLRRTDYLNVAVKRFFPQAAEKWRLSVSHVRGGIEGCCSLWGQSPGLTGPKQGAEAVPLKRTTYETALTI